MTPNHTQRKMKSCKTRAMTFQGKGYDNLDVVGLGLERKGDGVGWW